MSSTDFFTQLKEFLPKYVSPVPSYLHAFLVFSVIMVIGHVISANTDVTLDIDGDGTESATELKMKKFAFYGTSAIVGIIVADLAYTISWRLRNKGNSSHLTYRRWFPSIYSSDGK